MRTIYTLPLVLALAACATPQLASSNPRQVVIDNPIGRPDTAQAQRIADAECAKHGRFARMVAWPIQGVSRQWVFDCVQ
jgi:hypothetical protein